MNSLDHNTPTHMPFAGLLMPENLSKLPQCSCMKQERVMKAAHLILSLVTKTVLISNNTEHS